MLPLQNLIDELLEAAPPLSAQQLSRLRTLFSNVETKDDDYETCGPSESLSAA